MCENVDLKNNVIEELKCELERNLNELKEQNQNNSTVSNHVL